MTSFRGDIREDAEKMSESMLSMYEPVLFAINNDRFEKEEFEELHQEKIYSCPPQPLVL